LQVTLALAAKTSCLVLLISQQTKNIIPAQIKDFNFTEYKQVNKNKNKNSKTADACWQN